MEEHLNTALLMLGVWLILFGIWYNWSVQIFAIAFVLILTSVVGALTCSSGWWWFD